MLNPIPLVEPVTMATHPIGDVRENPSLKSKIWCSGVSDPFDSDGQVVVRASAMRDLMHERRTVVRRR
jgi:hypothetical protein